MHSWLFEQDGGLGREGECEAFLNFLSLVVGLLLPVVLAIKTEPPASLQRWERSAARGGGGGPTVAGGGGKKVRLRDALARANLSLEGSIRHACGRSWLAPAGGGGAGPWLELQPWERGLALWLTLSMLWALAVVAARA